MKTMFTVGGKHVVELNLSVFGREIYSVDGKEILRKRNLSLRSVTHLSVGDGSDKHDVEVRLNGFPSLKKSLIDGDFAAQAFIDGQLAVEHLFPRAQLYIRRVNIVLNWALVALFTFLALGVIIHEVISR